MSSRLMFYCIFKKCFPLYPSDGCPSLAVAQKSMQIKKENFFKNFIYIYKHFVVFAEIYRTSIFIWIFVQKTHHG